MKNSYRFQWKLLLMIVVLACASLFCGRGQQPEGDVEQPQEEVSPPEQPIQEEEPQQEDQASQVDLLASQTEIVSGDDPNEVRINLAIRNQGSGEVPSDFTVVWYPHGSTDEVGCSWDVSARRINQGQEEVDCAYTYPTHGEMHWRIAVDARNEVGESDEGNNTTEGTVVIQRANEGQEELTAPTNCSWKLATVPRVIVLSWDYSGPNDIDGFIIYMGTTSVVKWMGINTTETMIPDLELSTQYHFDVRSYKGDQQSAVDACFVDATTGQ